ncbi:MAG: TetR/AcrR family transcriptional regulator [Polyangiaceae bacterium]|nr:TetR/AcrR family transcriptional regulator [Polyangiaceae bacterium]
MSQPVGPKEGRRARKRRELRERIQRAAQELFLELGYDHVTVEEVAERADVSRATFFNYYSSKVALLRELAEKLTDDLHKRIEERRDDSVSTEEQLRRLFHDLQAAVQKTRRLSQDIFHETLRSDDSDERSEDYRPVRLSYRSLVEAGQARGDIDPAYDPDFLSEMIAGTVAALLGNWLNEPGYPIDERSELSVRFLAQAMKPGSASAAPVKTTP